MTETGVVAVGGAVVAVVAGVDCVEGAAVDGVGIAIDAGAVAAAGGAHVPADVASGWLGAGARLHPTRATRVSAAKREAARNEGGGFMGRGSSVVRDQPNVTPWKGQAEASLIPIR